MRGNIVHGNCISLCKIDLRKFIIENCYDMLTIFLVAWKMRKNVGRVVFHMERM
jgi:hypothetical protein